MEYISTFLDYSRSSLFLIHGNTRFSYLISLWAVAYIEDLLGQIDHLTGKWRTMK